MRTKPNEDWRKESPGNITSTICPCTVGTWVVCLKNKKEVNKKPGSLTPCNIISATICLLSVFPNVRQSSVWLMPLFFSMPVIYSLTEFQQTELQFKIADIIKKNINSWGICVSQSVKRPTLAQVIISQFLSLSLTSGSLLSARACFRTSVPFSLYPSPLFAFALS